MSTLQQVDENLFRGPRVPITDLSELGIKTVVNLQVGYFEFFHQKAKRELAECTALGISYCHLPLDDFIVPSRDRVQTILNVLRNSRDNGPVYFHCLHGVDRTGFIAGQYRVHSMGWPISSAIEEWRKLGFHTFPYGLMGWERQFNHLAKEKL